MNCKRVSFWHCQVYKHFCTSNATLHLKREAKFLNKLLTKGQKNKNVFWQADTTPSVPTVSGGSYKVSFTNNPRRVTVLNKVFMEHVTDLMASSELAKDLENKGFEVTNVQISKNFKHLNIYWFARTDLEEVENILSKSAGMLCHELNQLQIVGMVPKIHFVKNLHQYNVNRINELFSQIDLSGDPEEEVVEEVKETASEEDIDENENVYAINVPTMKNDVFNVDYTAIMSRINDELKRTSMANHRRERRLAEIVNMERPEIEDFASHKEKSNMMTQFLKQRSVSIRKKEMASLDNLMEYKRIHEEAASIYEEEEEDDVEDFPNYHKYQVQNSEDGKQI